MIQKALTDEDKLVRWYRARAAGLPTAAIAAALAAAGSDVAAMAAVGIAADADTIISARVELLDEKQGVMRQLVEFDESFTPPADYKVCLRFSWALLGRGQGARGGGGGGCWVKRVG